MMRFVLSIASLSLLSLPNVALGATCRCFSYDSCFPKASDLATLASQLSQPLLHPVPPESACYPVNNPSGDCATVQQKTTDGIWRATQPGAMQEPQYETLENANGTISACYLNTTIGAPCEQGNVPSIGVDARTVNDLQVAVKFAKKFNLRVVVKSTGHDYLGRSTGRGAFMIWTHNIKDIVYNPAFVPYNAPPSDKYKAITLGPGVQWRDAYNAINAQGGQVLVGGRCDTVGAAAGWVMGGGHSPLSTAFGLGVDNVIQFSVVTSEGNVLVVNSRTNADLFWALRGGGGGSFAIVTAVTYKTHGPTTMIGQTMVAQTSNHDTFNKLVTEFIRISPALSDAGWAGYTSIGGSEGVFYTVNGAPNITWDQANATWNPFFDFANNLVSEGLQISTALTVPFDSWYSWYNNFLPPELVGSNYELGTRLLSRSLVTSNYQQVAETLTTLEVGYLMIAGGAVAKVGPDATAVHPSWRSAIAMGITALTWPEGLSLAEINTLRDGFKQGMSVLATLAGPDAGSYYNEAMLYETNPQQVFFGSHYTKLESIKKIYDPSDMFIVREGVGSEKWDKDFRCRV